MCHIKYTMQGYGSSLVVTAVAYDWKALGSISAKELILNMYHYMLDGCILIASWVAWSRGTTMSFLIHLISCRLTINRLQKIWGLNFRETMEQNTSLRVSFLSVNFQNYSRLYFLLNQWIYFSTVFDSRLLWIWLYFLFSIKCSVQFDCQ